jgi:pimeloyl-ACP methyl ester carboxylesterase
MTPWNAFARVAPAGLVLAGAIALGAGCEPKAAQQEDPTVRTDTGFVAGPAGRLHVDDGGLGGVPVVFVHSFAGNTTHWAAQLTHLRSMRRALAIDLRGHGRSDPPADTTGWAVDSLAADLAAAADGLGLDRFVLVGHSMGGSAAAAYARRHPERLAGLVLVGTPGKAPPGMAAPVLASMRADYDSVMAGYWNRLLEGATPATQQKIRAGIEALPRQASLALIAAIFADDPTPGVRAFPGPRLLIDTAHGDGPAALHPQVPDVPRRVIAGTSHWPQLDKPDEFNALLDEFLSGAGAPGDTL